MKIHQSQTAPVDTADLRDMARAERAALETEELVRRSAVTGKLPSTRNSEVTANGARNGGISNPAPTAGNTTAPAPMSAEEMQAARLQEYQAIKLQQRQRKKALVLCEPLLTVNWDCLSLRDYPLNQDLEIARRRRDIWLMALCLFFAIFILGLLGAVSALIGGIAFGAAFATLSFAIRPFRLLFFQAPSYAELMASRREIEYKAITHIAVLEGRNGLARHFYLLQEYNPALKNRTYQKLMAISARANVVKALSSPGRIRLYQQLLLEANQAYIKLREAFFENERRLLDEFKEMESAIPPTGNDLATQVPAKATGNP